MNETFILTALFMGLAGSGHCIAMCGGVASSLQMAIKDKKNIKSYTLLYNLGRLISYTFAGAIVAGISSQFASRSNLFSQSLVIISAIFMVLVGLYIMRVFAGLKWIEAFGKIAIWQHIVKLNKYLLPLNSKIKALSYGAIWGWLPCGLVYSALTWAITGNNALEGALFMLFFGLGTMPAMIGLGLTTQILHKILNKNYVRVFMGSILIIYGLIFGISTLIK